MNYARMRAYPGLPEPVAIDMLPSDDPAEITAEGLVGDTKITARDRHPDQAVSIYLDDDYSYWRAQLRRALDPGTFGENLTIADLRNTGINVGDRFAIDDVVLEVTAHRGSSPAFDIKMGSPDWSRRFRDAGRPGAYCRVINPGTIVAGAEVEYVPFEGETVDIARLALCEGASMVAPQIIERALKAPLHAELRSWFEGLRGLAQLAAAGFPVYPGDQR